MTDHLYPARPGMLRRGTPVVRADGPMRGRQGVGLGLDDRGCYGIAWTPGEGVWLGPGAAGRMLALDLRDVTARAHAAWVYTRVSGDVRRIIDELSSAQREAFMQGSPADYDRIRWLVRRIMRMALGDESVTVEEAREALDWAHEVTQQAEVTND
jgi:hypothetical protein